MAVYSHSFLSASVSSGEAVTYTVPAGLVAVLRSITAAGGPGVSSEVIVEVNGDFVKVIGVTPVYPGGSAGGDWEGRIVLPPAATLTVILDTAGGVQVSGYLLTS